MHLDSGLTWRTHVYGLTRHKIENTLFAIRAGILTVTCVQRSFQASTGVR